MPRQRPDLDGYYVAPGTLTYNVRCEGDICFNKVTLRNLRELRADCIEWVWCGQNRRYLSKDEIAKLCALES